MATVASGVTVMWPSTNASIPSGWSRVTSLDGKYIKGTAAGVDPDVTGGALTHTHTDSGHTHSISAHTHSSNPATGTPTGNNQAVGSVNSSATTSHTHTVGTSSSDSGTSGSTAGGWQTGSSEPAYVDVIWISSNGTPTGIPINAWAFWNSNPVPTSWTQPTAGKNKHPKGAAAAGDGGGTGGGGSHTHTANSHVHTVNHSHSVTSGGATGTTTPQNAHANQTADSAHTHSVSFTAGESVGSQTSAASGGTTYEPAWKKLVIAQNSTGAVDFPTNIIAVWLGLLANIPTNWTLCDGTSSTPDMRGQFIKGVDVIASEIGNTGGTAGHSHSDPSTHTHTEAHTHGYSAAWGGVLNGTGSIGSSGTISTDHTHAGTSASGGAANTGSGTQTAPSTTDTQPPFRTVAFISYLGGLVVTVDSPTADQVMTSPSFLVDWSFTGGSGTQNDYRVKVYDSDQTTMIYDSGQQTSATTSATLPSGYLLNSHSYYIEVTVHDTTSPAREGISAKRHITTSWTPPATITGLSAVRGGVTGERDVV